MISPRAELRKVRSPIISSQGNAFSFSKSISTTATTPGKILAQKDSSVKKAFVLKLCLVTVIFVSLSILRKGKLIESYVNILGPVRLLTEFDRLRLIESKPPQKPKQRRQEVIIVIGLASSNYNVLEKDLIEWSKEYKIRPYTYSLPDLNPELYSYHSGFQPFISALKYKVLSSPRGFAKRNHTEGRIFQTLIQEFRDQFNSHWMQNKHLIIGSDALNSFQSNIIRERVVNILESLMPWNDARFSLYGSNERITAVVCYTSERVKQLQSIWKVTNSNQRFVSWLTSEEGKRNLDIFSTANELKMRGANVVVLDIDDIFNSKRSISHSFACEILDMACTKDGLLQSIPNATHSFKTENDSAPFDDGDKYDVIEKILHDYDCSFGFLSKSKCSGSHVKKLSLNQLVESIRTAL